MAQALGFDGRRGIYQILQRDNMSRYGTDGTHLAESRGTWHGARMEQQSGKASRAGGAIIAFLVIAGALIGNHLGEPSLGTLIGTGVGVAITLALYIYDRRQA